MTDPGTHTTRDPEAASLYSLVYSSTATEPFDDDALQKLLAHSRESNSEADITGMLLYRKGRFVQFLEGPESQVRELMSVISADPRHTGIRIMMDGHADARRFAEWTMGYEPVREPNGSLPVGFRSTFDDLELQDDPDAVLRATRELSLWFRVRAERP